MARGTEETCREWIRTLCMKENCEKEWLRFKRLKRRMVVVCLTAGSLWSAFSYATGEDTWPQIVCFAALISVMLPYAANSNLKDRLKKREEQLAADYPVIVMKLALFMEAGMSLRRAWESVASGYEAERGRRFAYEEMRLTLTYLRSGGLEMGAYGEFGRRCGIYSYRKLGSLLEQNVKLGGRNLTALLFAEVEEAFEKRQNQAVKKGQEAQSGLLLPMMVMLAVCLAVVIAPAFLSMGF